MFTTIFEFNVPKEHTTTDQTGIFFDIEAEQVSTFRDGTPSILIRIQKTPIWHLNCVKSWYDLNHVIETLVKQKYDEYKKLQTA